MLALLREHWSKKAVRPGNEGLPTVADAVATWSALAYGELRDMVAPQLGAAAGPDDTVRALRSLRHLGFDWQSGPNPRWELDIPSLTQ